MLLALKHFFEEDSKALADKYLDKDYFNGLLIGGDPVRDLLQWLNDAEAFQAACETDKWQAFLALCQSRWAFQPEKTVCWRAFKNCWNVMGIGVRVGAFL